MTDTPLPTESASKPKGGSSRIPLVVSIRPNVSLPSGLRNTHADGIFVNIHNKQRARFYSGLLPSVPIQWRYAVNPTQTTTNPGAGLFNSSHCVQT